MGQEYIRVIDVRSLSSVPGRVLIFDDFSKGKAFTASYTGADGRVEISQAQRFNSQASCRLKTRATSPAASDNATMSRYCNITPYKQIQFDVDFMLATNADTKLFKVELIWRDATNNHEAAIRYDPQTNKWQYLNSANGWTDITGGTQYLSDSGWHHLSLVVDYLRDEYISARADNLAFDLSDIDLYIHSGSTNNDLILSIILYANATTPPVAYLSNLVLSIP